MFARVSLPSNLSKRLRGATTALAFGTEDMVRSTAHCLRIIDSQRFAMSHHVDLWDWLISNDVSGSSRTRMTGANATLDLLQSRILVAAIGLSVSP